MLSDAPDYDDASTHSQALDWGNGGCYEKILDGNKKALGSGGNGLKSINKGHFIQSC